MLLPYPSLSGQYSTKHEHALAASSKNTLGSLRFQAVAPVRSVKTAKPNLQALLPLITAKQGAAIIASLQKDLIAQETKAFPNRSAEEIRETVNRALLFEVRYLEPDRVSFRLGQQFIFQLFEQGQYEGPMPLLTLNPALSALDSRYSSTYNCLELGTETKLSNIFHELTHYEGLLDVAVAQAYYHRLPLYKKLFTKWPAVPVAPELEAYVVSKKRHLDPGWVQLGYDTAKDLAFSRKANSRYNRTGKDQDWDRYTHCREERIAEIVSAQQTKNILYQELLKTIPISDRRK